jgi:23S rRNA pseudouridine1911/1915/1917 synthase
VVYGRPEPAAGTWRDHLAWDSEELIQQETDARDPRAAEAIADYRVLEPFRETSLIEVRLRTGKRNQIRIQARLHGHTLVGERRYVDEPGAGPIEFARQALHARRLEFEHPETRRTLAFEAPLPPDMQALVERLRADLHSSSPGGI